MWWSEQGLLTGEYIPERELPRAIIGTGENGRQQNRSRPSVRDYAQNAIGKTVTLVLLAFNGAPADIFAAEAVVPVDIGH